jgi:hypothetical protein
MNTGEYLEFLHGQREGWAVAMSREGNRMSNIGVYRMPDELHTMTVALKARSTQADVYASVYLFDKPRRLAPYALPSDVLYLEVDEPEQAWRGVEPTLTVESSPGKYHHYWRVDRDVPTDERRRLLAAMVSEGEGDPAAKDVSRVLRPPGTYSHKRGWPVQAVGGSGEVYSVAAVIGDRQVPSPPKRGRAAADGTDLVHWLEVNDVPAEPRDDELGIKFSVACPWEDQHSTPGNPYVGKIEGGGLWFWCPHSSCQGRTWRDFHNYHAPLFGFGKVLKIGGRAI